MEGIKEKIVASNNLVVSLSKMVQRECFSIDLFIGVGNRKQASKISGLVVPLAKTLGIRVGDVCYLSLRLLSAREGLEKWRVLTTHGHVDVTKLSGEIFKTEIHENHLPHNDIYSRIQLDRRRNEEISGLKGLSKTEESCYAKIQGNVVLCGDFSTWNPIGLLALHKLFLANRANNVVFVTPAILSGHYRMLAKEGCKVICLRPQRKKQIGFVN